MGTEDFCCKSKRLEVVFLACEKIIPVSLSENFIPHFFKTSLMLMKSSYSVQKSSSFCGFLIMKSAFIPAKTDVLSYFLWGFLILNHAS